MKRAVALMVVSLSACDFEAEFDRSWCAKHPTTPTCPDAGATLRPDAGTDAGESDAGVDAGVVDAGDRTDGGNVCTSRQLVFDAVDGGEAGACTPVTLRVVCAGDGRPAPVTRVTHVTLTSTIDGGARGEFFNGSACETLISAPMIQPQVALLPLHFKSTTSGINPSFGPFTLTATAADDAGQSFTSASAVLEQEAGLTFGTNGVINVPIDGGCVALPALALRSAVGDVVAPAALAINWPTPSGFTACVSAGMTLAAGATLDAGIQLSAGTASTSTVTMTAITLDPLVRHGSIQVHACLAQGPTTDDRLCCTSTTPNHCD